MRLDTNLLEQLPAWYRRILDYQELCLAEGEELKALAADMEAVRANFFFQTMDLGAVRLWEQVFRISPAPAAETLEFRRLRLLNRMASQPPFDLAYLKIRLDSLIGPEKYSVEVDYPGFALYIAAQRPDRPYAREIEAMLSRILPAHIDWALVVPLKLPVKAGTGLGQRYSCTVLPMYRPEFPALKAPLSPLLGGAESETALPMAAGT